MSAKSALAVTIRYALTRWEALVRYCDDGHIEIDNNAAERVPRACFSSYMASALDLGDGGISKL